MFAKKKFPRKIPVHRLSGVVDENTIRYNRKFQGSSCSLDLAEQDRKLVRLGICGSAVANNPCSDVGKV